MFHNHEFAVLIQINDYFHGVESEFRTVLDKNPFLILYLGKGKVL